MTHKAHTQKGYATYKRWLLQVLDLLVGYALCVKRCTARTCKWDNMAHSISACNYAHLHSLRKCVCINKLGNFYFKNMPTTGFLPRPFCGS